MNDLYILTARRCSEKAECSSDTVMLSSYHISSGRGHESDGINMHLPPQALPVMGSFFSNVSYLLYSALEIGAILQQCGLLSSYYVTVCFDLLKQLYLGCISKKQ